MSAINQQERKPENILCLSVCLVIVSLQVVFVYQFVICLFAICVVCLSCYFVSIFVYVVYTLVDLI